eukprot:scaffold76528_cov48-Phaeocystis_antarctica.AAC.2
MPEAGKRPAHVPQLAPGQAALGLRYVRRAGGRVAPASRASTFSGSCGSDCGESVHMAATRPGTRRATRPAGRDPPCSRSAVAVVMAVKRNHEARMPSRGPSVARRSARRTLGGGKRKAVGGV